MCDTIPVWHAATSSILGGQDYDADWMPYVVEDQWDDVQVHVDEKWFLLMKNGERVRIYPTIDANGNIQYKMPPAPKLASKRHMGKIMVFTAISRPLYDEFGNCIFDGKVHIESLIVTDRYTRGKRKGQKRAKTISVDGKKIRQVMGRVYKAIKQKMQCYKARHIWVPLDTARPHTAVASLKYYKALKTKAENEGWKIEVTLQPPRSPDMNVNDLMLYKALGAMVNQTKNIRSWILIEP